MKYLKIQSLDKGWHDRDEIILHSAFQALVYFVEGEKPDQIVDWNHNAMHKRAWKEITSLYRWWKEQRPARRSPLDDKRLCVPPLKFKRVLDSDYSALIEPDKKKYAEYYRALKRHGKLEEQWHEEDQHNLHRLIDIRDFLWT